jgi:hypothetical protein
MQKLKVLLNGQIINLCRPTNQFAGGDIWYKWLNRPKIIRNLEERYKKSKNTKKKQIDFFKNQKKKRKIFIISTKNHVYKGVVSLSYIDYKKKTCDIALITDSTIEPHLAPYAGLEAIAILSEYAFLKLKMKKIHGVGKINLRGWQQRMELLGYKLNYLLNENDTNSKLKNELSYDISLLYDDFKLLKKKRGKLWDDIDMMKSRISKLPKNSFLDNLKKFLIDNKKNYYNEIFKL